MDIPKYEEVLQIESDVTKSEINSLDNFNKLISESNYNIKFIEKKLEELKAKKSSLLDANKDEELELSKKIININDDITEARGRMDKIIKDLEKELDQESEKDDSELRTKQNLFDSMIKKYQRVIQRLSDEETNMKNIKEEKLIRNAEIGIGRDLTKKEKEQVMENPKIIEQIYKDRLQGKGHDKLLNAVRDLEDRHKDIKKLEKSIIELSKMVTELSKLVKYQGELIDNIVENVSKSKDYVDKAEIQLEKGKENLESARKKKCIIAIIVCVILLIILIPVLVKLL
jgi:syntaxin 1B/2/3